METLKSAARVIGPLAAVLYCGGLLYYFLDFSGSVQEAGADGLGPTLLGLGVVGLLFCIPLIARIVRIFAGPPGSVGGGGGPGVSPRDREGGLDADAVLARYLAPGSREALPGSPTAPPASEGDGPVRPQGFGRRTR